MCAVAGIIEEAERRAGPGRLTLRLQELGGLVRIASDIAVIEGASLAGASHVERTLAMALSAEEQLNGAASSLIPTERPPVVRLTRQGEGLPKPAESTLDVEVTSLYGDRRLSDSGI